MRLFANVIARAEGRNAHSFLAERRLDRAVQHANFTPLFDLVFVSSDCQDFPDLGRSSDAHETVDCSAPPNDESITEEPGIRFALSDCDARGLTQYVLPRDQTLRETDNVIRDALNAQDMPEDCLIDVNTGLDLRIPAFLVERQGYDRMPADERL